MTDAPTPADIEALLARVPKGHPEFMIFEPCAHFGTEYLHEEWPFGWISLATPTPVFEIKPILGFHDKFLRMVAELSALAPELATAVRHLAAENARLHARLEDSHVWVTDADGREVMTDVPPGSIPDGIAARDETIRLQDAEIRRLEEENSQMRKRMEA